MSLTLEELKEKMKNIDEISIIERLEIYSDELVERFLDKIEEKWEQLVLDFEEEDIDE
jgi:hypothetical protein